MTLTQLKYVITVAEARSMNEAAKQLFISQPSLSSAIKELEEEIGVEVFRRSNKGVFVTPEGEEFVGYARQVVEQYMLIETKYIDKTNVKKKFGVSTQHYTFAVNAFVEMVKQFGMDEYEFAIHETKTFEVIENVKNFKSEIGILYINEFNQKILYKLFSEYGLEFHPILDCHIYVYMWKGHPLAGNKEIALEELEDYP
ncbi:MAG: LysR family transcriptional regulator, partial [Clostridia bacterium]|nr:LysR family transcriptional regulator [Clostridia bacterium]